jgi:hypothetical protein
MKTNHLIIVIATLAIALMVAVLVWPEPAVRTAAPGGETAPETPASAPASAPVYGDSLASTSDFAANNTTPQAPSASAAAEGLTPKEQTIETINDAMLTYSAEGVPVLAPLLANPDEEIRAEAIEAMKQLGVPEAAGALRYAASRTSDPEEKATLLEAAEFVETPPLMGAPR